MASKAQSTIARQILDEAADWFVDFRVREMNAPERAQFDRWLRQSPQHIQAYLEIAAVYADLPALEPSLTANLDELVQRARADSGADIVPFATCTPSHPPRHAHPRRALLAASLAALAALAVLVGARSWVLWRNHNVYATGIGEERSITLADGSIVDLNARTRVRVRYTSTEREIDLLQGQALFIDTQDPHRPFIVHASGTDVRAVGTQFDVNREATETLVTVIEGRVAVTAARSQEPGESAIAPLDTSTLRKLNFPTTPRPILLAAGEEVAIADGSAEQPHAADLAAATAWRRHQLIFDATPLADVVEEFNRFSERQLVIDSPVLDHLKISGMYSSTDPTSFVRFLRAQPGIVVTQSNGTTHIDQSAGED